MARRSYSRTEPRRLTDCLTEDDASPEADIDPKCQFGSALVLSNPTHLGRLGLYPTSRPPQANAHHHDRKTLGCSRIESQGAIYTRSYALCRPLVHTIPYIVFLKPPASHGSSYRSRETRTYKYTDTAAHALWLHHLSKARIVPQLHRVVREVEV